MVGAVGIEIASLLSKSNKENGVAPPPFPNWSLLERIAISRYGSGGNSGPKA
jgi:hypothetical protein